MRTHFPCASRSLISHRSTIVATASASETGRIRLTGSASGRHLSSSALDTAGDQFAEEQPRLAGQNTAYMRGRMQRWKNGIDAGSDTAAIMAPIARLMSEQQIEEVVGYFSTLAPATGGASR